MALLWTPEIRYDRNSTVNHILMSEFFRRRGDFKNQTFNTMYLVKILF